MTKVDLWVDGGCRPNPGRGGWATIVDCESFLRLELKGGHPKTTNNRMELTAVIAGLQVTPDGSNVTVHTDSTYVAGYVNGEFGSPKKNADLVRELEMCIARHKSVRAVLVRGHAGVELNEQVHHLVQLEIDT